MTNSNKLRKFRFIYEIDFKADREDILKFFLESFNTVPDSNIMSIKDEEIEDWVSVNFVIDGSMNGVVGWKWTEEIVKWVKDRRNKIIENNERIKNSGKEYYCKSGILYEYKNNSRAKYMSDLRKKNRRPDNVSPDYTNQLYDIEYKKDKNNKSKVIKTFNKDKAEALIWKLSYQFKIKHTVLTFKDINGNILKASKIEEISSYILNQTIDMSFGIYANQTHHLNLNRDELQFCNYTIKALCSNAKKYLNKVPGSYIIYESRFDSKKHSIRNALEFSFKEDEINWNKTVMWYTSIPQGKLSKQWNSEYDGRWLRLTALSNSKKVEEYELKIKASKVLKSTILIKSMIDNGTLAEYPGFFSRNGSVLYKFMKRFNRFSYKQCNKLIQTQSLIDKIAKYFGKYFKSFRDVSGFISTSLQGSLIAKNTLVFINFLAFQLCNKLNIPLDERVLERFEYAAKDKFSASSGKDIDITCYRSIEEMKEVGSKDYDHMTPYEKYISEPLPY